MQRQNFDSSCLAPHLLREEIHRHPELFFQEFKTTELIKRELQKIAPGNLTFHQPLATGLVVEYCKSEESSSPYVLFRADLDALPIQEKTSVSYQSCNQYMHACGHDVHTAILYGLILKIVELQPKKNFLFVFQPAEEEGGGAKALLQSPFFQSEKIKNKIEKAYALHVSDEYEVGELASKSGGLFATALAIDIDFIGTPAHLAFPSRAKNPLTAMRWWMDEAEKISIEMKDKAQNFIFGFGKVQAGTVRNIYPETARLEGSIRSEFVDDAYNYLNHLKILLTECEKKFGIQTRLNIASLYHPVMNDPQLFETSRSLLKNVGTWIDCEWKMTGEDFGYFTDVIPSFMFWLGSREKNSTMVGLHHPQFLPPHSAIDEGIRFFLALS